LQELADIVTSHFQSPRLQLFTPGRPVRALGRAMRGVGRVAAPRLVRQTDVLFDYAFADLRFDVRNTSEAGLRAPPVSRYFERLMHFAWSNDFGRGKATQAPT